MEGTMNLNKEQMISIQDRLQKEHPEWPQEKARWIAMQALNMIPTARR